MRLASATWRAVGGLVAGSGVPPGGLSRRDGRLVVLQTSDALRGVGEASPLPGYSRDSLADVDAALPGVCAALVGRAIAQPRDIDACIAEVALPSLRFAVETALWCLLAGSSGRPLHRLWRPPGPWRGVPLRFLAEVDVDAVRLLWSRGVRRIKWKVGRDCERELAQLRTLRAALPSLRIQLDANGGLALGDLEELCAAYAACDVELVEEPTNWRALADGPRLPVPVALDESLQAAAWSDRLAAVARTQRVAAVVLKPTALGGLRQCFGIADAARGLGAQAIVTHTFDGPIAMAAAAELVLALPDATSAGLAPHAALAAFGAGQGAALGPLAVASHECPALGLPEAWC